MIKWANAFSRTKESRTKIWRQLVKIIHFVLILYVPVNINSVISPQQLRLLSVLRWCSVVGDSLFVVASSFVGVLCLLLVLLCSI